MVPAVLRRRDTASGITAALLFVGLSGSGCGGSRGQGVTTQRLLVGRAALAVRWPEPSRLIPFAANSIRIRLVRGNVLLGERLLVRPVGGGESVAFFERLPVGAGGASAVAFPLADGTGVAQAQAEVGFTVAANQTTDLRLTMASTIERVEVTPASASLNVGQGVSLSAGAKNAAGETVLTHPSKVEWRSLTPSVATVDVTGRVTAVSAGTGTVEVTEMESGKTGAATVIVSAPNPGQLLIYDGFAYTPGASLSGQNGGSGWSGPWTHSGAGTTFAAVAGSLTFGNLLVSGNSFKSNSFSPGSCERQWQALPVQPGAVRYWSLLVRPENVTGGFPGPYFGFAIPDRFIGKSSDNAPLGINRGGNGEFVSAGVVAQANTTYFLVVRLTYGATNDTYEMFVNPAPGQPLPAVPNATQVRPHTTEPLVATGIGSSVPCVFDELRVGTTWEAVSPTTP